MFPTPWIVDYYWFSTCAIDAYIIGGGLLSIQSNNHQNEASKMNHVTLGWEYCEGIKNCMWKRTHWLKKRKHGKKNTMMGEKIEFTSIWIWK